MPSRQRQVVEHFGRCLRPRQFSRGAAMLAGGGAPPFGIAALSPLRFDRAPFRVSSVPATIAWRGAALQLCICFSLQTGEPCPAYLLQGPNRRLTGKNVVVRVNHGGRR